MNSINQNESKFNKFELNIDDEFLVDNLKIRILGVKNPEIADNFGNNQSVIIKIITSFNTSLLFLGDTGIESEAKLLDKYYNDIENIDYIQMSHHGQNGVDENMYKVANPKICLWPTPEWLWNNDSGEGENSGPWKTFETRNWIEKINAKNYIAKDGDILLKIY